MNIRHLLLTAAVLPVLIGCANANSQSENQTNALVTPPPAVVPTNALASTNPVVAPEAVAPAVQVVNTEFTPPANLKLSPAVTDVAKMAQAGVDPAVMLTYVTNSVHTFGLEADDIVYLNDLGLSPEVVSAMIRHDQQIREASLAGATATSPATPAPSSWTAGAAAPAADTWQQTVTAPAAAAPEADVALPPPAEERPEAVTVDHFYDSLSPYGTWVDIEGYGRCWRPTVAVASPGWRPYSNGGRWVWTDSGWYWYSDYSWGWAPFHYGRWFSHSNWGWCWVPGTVWGPSWVSWRYTDAYCGWAPLPPAAYYSPGFGFTYYGSSCGVGFSFGIGWSSYTFVSYNNFHGHHYDRHCAPPHESHHAYNHSTVANHYVHGKDNRLINNGIPPSRIESASGTPVRQMNIREGHTPQNSRVTRQEQIGSDGRTLNVVRSSVPGRTPAVRAGSASNGRTGASSALQNAGTATQPRTETPHSAPPRTASAASMAPPTRSETPRTSSSSSFSHNANSSPQVNAQPGAVVRTETSRGSVETRSPQVQNTPDTRVAIAAPQPPGTAPAAQPRTVRSTTSPWTVPTRTTAPGQSQAQPTVPTRTGQAPQLNVRTHSYTSPSPAPVAEATRQTPTPRPATVSPSAPVRTYVPPASPRVQNNTPVPVRVAPTPPPRTQAPSAPVRSYEPPRSTPAPQAAPSQPSYSAPTRSSSESSQSSFSAPTRSAPISPHNPSSGSSKSGGGRGR